MISKRQVKITLLSATAGYLLSEYFVLRRGAKIMRQNKINRAIEMESIDWAQHMVEKEAMRGKYNHGNIQDVYADFDYYHQIARLRH